MRTRNYVFIGIVCVVALAIFLIFVTLPPSPSANNISGNPAASLPTPTVDATDHFNGGHLDGQLLFSRAGSVWAWQGNQASRLAIFPGKSSVADSAVQLFQAVWSPNRTQIAYIRQDESFSDLWVVNADGSNNRNLTNNRGAGVPHSDTFAKSSLWAYSPAWSPDGSQLAYLSDIKTDDLGLWVISAKGGQQPRKISAIGSGQGGIQHVSWSSVGNQLAVAAYNNGKIQLYLINATTGKETQLTEATEGAYDPAFSPDGKYIVYTQHKGNGSELWMLSVNGESNSAGTPIFLAPGPTRSPAFSADGSKIVYLGLKGAYFEIFEVSVNSAGTQGSPQQISDNAQVDANGGLSWSR